MAFNSEIASSARLVVAGPRAAIAAAAITMQLAMKANTPPTPKRSSKKAMMKSAEHGGKPAPGIDEAHRTGADAGRIKLCLIGMVEEGHHVIRERDQHAEAISSSAAKRLCPKARPNSADAERRNDQQPFALEAVAEHGACERPKGRSNRDQKCVLQALR